MCAFKIGPSSRLNPVRTKRLWCLLQSGGPKHASNHLLHVFHGRCDISTNITNITKIMRADTDVYNAVTRDHAIAVITPKDGCALPKVGGSTDRLIAAGGDYIIEPRNGDPPPQGFNLTRVCNGNDELIAEVSPENCNASG
jgi:hypothetical protein